MVNHRWVKGVTKELTRKPVLLEQGFMCPRGISRERVRTGYRRECEVESLVNENSPTVTLIKRMRKGKGIETETQTRTLRHTPTYKPQTLGLAGSNPPRILWSGENRVSYYLSRPVS